MPNLERLFTRLYVLHRLDASSRGTDLKGQGEHPVNVSGCSQPSSFLLPRIILVMVKKENKVC